MDLFECYLLDWGQVYNRPSPIITIQTIQPNTPPLRTGTVEMRGPPDIDISNVVKSQYIDKDPVPQRIILSSPPPPLLSPPSLELEPLSLKFELLESPPPPKTKKRRKPYRTRAKQYNPENYYINRRRRRKRRRKKC